MIRRTLFLLTATLLLATGVASAEPTPEQKCEIAKNKAAAKKDVCLMAQDNKVIAGKTPNTAACETGFSKAFANAEKAAMKAGGSCPVTGDAATIEQRVDATQGGTAQYLAGDCRFHDNGDGTITDAETGLMWEKKSSDGSVHDEGNCYPRAFTCSGDNATLCNTNTACTTAGGTCQKGDCQTASPGGMTIFQWVAQLNTASFAGHADWRIPTSSELATIIDYSVAYPGPTVSAAFNSGCVASCTVTTCSCTAAFYWSSTLVAGFPFNAAWYVNFNFGSVENASKNTFLFARGVRAGS